MILGNGVGGVVAEVGTNVDERLLGRRVVTGTGGQGGYAERVAVDARGLIEVPIDLSLDTAVALLADGRTATALFRAVGVVPGERVLVEAAAGGVGSLLVQMAYAAGAVVIGAAGGQEKLELARDLGATFVADYRIPEWADTVRVDVGGVDVVFDGVGGEVGRAAFELVAPGGRLLSFGLASGSFTHVGDGEAGEHNVTLRRGVPVGPDEEAVKLTHHALNESVGGRLRAVIGQRFPLEDAAEAHRRIESRVTLGKTLLVAS
jgi:NADPH2:quinone reductase